MLIFKFFAFELTSRCLTDITVFNDFKLYSSYIKISYKVCLFNRLYCYEQLSTVTAGQRTYSDIAMKPVLKLMENIKTTSSN